MGQQGTHDISWFRGYWPGAQSEAGDSGGRNDFLKIVGGYVLEREIRMAPGFKCVIDPVSEDPGDDGYLSFVLASRRPVSVGTTSTDKLRWRMPVAAGIPNTLRDQYVWAEPAHLWSFHRVRDRLCLLGETRLCVEPILDYATKSVQCYVTAWVKSGGGASGPAIVTLGPDPGTLHSDSANQVGAGDVVFIDTLDDTNTADAARLNRKAHFVIAVSVTAGPVTTLTLKTEVTADSNSASLHGRIGRVRGDRDASLVTDTTGRAIYGETGDAALTDDDSLTAFWVEDAIDVDSTPITKLYPAHVANRQRDYGDYSEDRPHPGPFFTRQVEGHRPEGFGTNPIYGVPRRRVKRAPYRGVPQVAGDRILLAIPGYGCLFQVPAIVPGVSDIGSLPSLGAIDGYNDTATRPRSLGVPKAILCVPNAADGGALVTLRGNTTGYLANTTGGPVSHSMVVAAAYRDDSTGEIGQLSEVWTITKSIPASESVDVSILVMHPGYALAETMALSIMLFASRTDETDLTHIATVQLGDDDPAAWSGAAYQQGVSQSSVYGLLPSNGNGAAGSGEAIELYYRYLLPVDPVATPALFNSAVELPLERVMPRGGSWIRVVRGVPLSGGSIGNTGPKLELAGGQITLIYDKANSDQRKEITIRHVTKDYGLADRWFLVANETIPSGYAGLILWSRDALPFPMEMVQLDRIVNAHCTDPVRGATQVLTNGVRYYQRWSLVENPHRWDEQSNRVQKDAWLLLPRGQIQIHEPGLPSVSLAQGKQFLDANKDEDSVAGGEYRGAAMIFTQRHTYMMAWDHGPAGTVPMLLNSEFGCIAPNAVVEHDGGTLWISERGICEWNGGMVFAGRHIERWFREAGGRFLRDRRGMMRHAFGAWDESRCIAWIGLAENRSGSLSINDDDVTTSWHDADDEARSRFPCDTVLLYNSRLRAISELHPPSGLEMLWVGPLPCLDGVQRTGFLAADHRVYAMDDLWGDDNQEPLQVLTLADGSGTTIGVSASLSTASDIGQATANRAGTGSFVRAGMDVCICDANYKLRARTTAVSATAGSLVVTDSVTWMAGDFVLIGAKSMTIETAFFRPKQGGEAATISAIKPIARVTSRITAGKQFALPQPIWVKATLTYAEHQSGRHGGGATLSRSQQMHKQDLGDFMAISGTKDILRMVRMHGGQPTADAFKLTLEFFGGAQASLQDVVMEVG